MKLVRVHYGIVTMFHRLDAKFKPAASQILEFSSFKRT